MSEPAASNRSAPLALWRGARAFLEVLWQTFGGPADIAQQHVLSQRTYALICAWLRAGESILRQLLLIEAAALPRPDYALATTTAPTRTYRIAPAHAPEPLDDPTHWRVSFRCFASAGGGGGRSVWRERKSGGASLRPSFPVAARMEALLRAFNDPIPYAKRMLARLVRRPGRVHTLVRLMPDRSTRGAPNASAEIPGLRQETCKAALKIDTS